MNLKKKGNTKKSNLKLKINKYLKLKYVKDDLSLL